MCLPKHIRKRPEEEQPAQLCFDVWLMVAEQCQCVEDVLALCDVCR
jgi:hypothetical protein